MIWPVFCSALIVGRLAPLGLHNTRFRSVPLSCSPRTGADASSPRHETRRNVADSGSLGSRKGLRRRTSPVLYAPSAFSAMALPYGSPAVPAGGGMPHSPAPVAYTRPMRRAPWPERCAGPSAPPCEAAHDTACSGARGTGPLGVHGGGARPAGDPAGEHVGGERRAAEASATCSAFTAFIPPALSTIFAYALRASSTFASEHSQRDCASANARALSSRHAITPPVTPPANAITHTPATNGTSQRGRRRTTSFSTLFSLIVQFFLPGIPYHPPVIATGPCVPGRERPPSAVKPRTMFERVILKDDGHDGDSPRRTMPVRARHPYSESNVQGKSLY